MASRTPTVSRDHASRLLRLQMDAELSALELHDRGALLLAGNVRGEVLVFATATGALVQRLGAADPAAGAKPASPVTAVAWADELGEHVVAGHANGSVRVWHLGRGAVVASLAAHRSHVWALAAMPEAGLLATGGGDGNIKVWRLGADRTADGASASADGGGFSLHPSPGAPRVLKEPLQKLRGHAGEVSCLRFTPNASFLISGDVAGGLRVWEVASGSAGRLAHNLTGRHAGAITGIAVHPVECCFATCSADRTVRVWDMDAEPGSCIGVHGPEGRREVRGLAFTSDGRWLLAAYPDGLRTFTLDPLALQRTVDVHWSKVQSIRYTDGKAIGVTLFKGDAELHCVDLTRLAHTPGGSASASSESSAADVVGAAARGVRFSEKHPLPSQRQGAGSAAARPTAGTEPLSSSTAWLPTTSAFVPAAAPPSAGVAQPGPAAAFVAEQRRQVLEARGSALNASAEAHAPPVRPDRRSSAAFTAAAPSGRSGTDAGGTPQPAGGAARTSQGSEGRGSRPPRVSAEENGGGLGAHSRSASLKAEAPAGQCSAAPAASPQDPAQRLEPPSMLEVASHRGFLAEALSGSRQQCARLRASRALFGEVKAALQRGDVMGAVSLLKGGNDLSVAAKVVESGALQRARPDRFTPELCAAAAPLAAALLSPPASPLHHQAGLALLEAILGRWGEYVQSALSPLASRGRKVDLAQDQRQERSHALRAALQALAPPLERLAGTLGGGRAAQMLARVRAL